MLYTNNYTRCKKFIKRWEGGFVNHPKDPGGATNSGITISTFRQYFGSDKTVQDLKDMTEDQWDTIFWRGYYSKMRANEIKNPSIALLCVDMCWGSGPITAIRKIQRCLGTTPDGIVGPKTLGLLNAKEEEEVFNRLWKMREEWFKDIVRSRPSSAVFLKGWLNRLNSIKFEKY